MTTPLQPIIDEETRKKATSDFSTSFSVEASAGTGKTTLLANRYVNLLQSGAGKVSTIVAITFTEKAANELKERIEKILREKNLSSQLDDLKDAYVSTIHAFCARVLRERALEVGLNPEFEVMDPMTTSMVLKKYFYQWLSSLGDGSLGPIQRAMASGIKLEKIFDLAMDIYRYRDLSSGLNAVHEEESVAQWLQETSHEIQRLWERAQNCCINPHDLGFEQIEQLSKFMANVATAREEELERAFLHRFYVKAPKGTQKNWNPPAALKEQKEALERIAQEAKRIQENLRARIFGSLLQVLKTYVEFVEAEKRKLSQLDFDDLLFQTKALLRDNEGALLGMQRQFTHLLIDEYQDTDPIQAEIIWRLSSQGIAKDWMEAKLAPGKLFCVGDPKQSIYRFRRASIEVYKETSAALTRYGERLVIFQNFRSSEMVVQGINGVFEKIYEPSYEPLVARKGHLFDETKLPVVLLEPPKNVSDAGADDARKIEAQMISKYLHGILRSEGPCVYDSKLNALRKATPGDVAILFPTSTGMDYYEEALREYQIPFSVEGGTAFFHRLEVHGILAVLRALMEPNEGVSVVAALKSVVFGLSDEDLYQLVQSKKSFDYRTQDVSEMSVAVQTAYAILKNLHEHVSSSPSHVLGKIIDATWAIPISLFRFHGEQAAANIQKLHLLSLHLESSGVKTCRQFLSWIEETTREKSSETEALLSEADDQHVRLLTIHRSKGLEFPIVVLANLSGSSTMNESVLCNRQEGWIEVGMGSEERRFATPNYENRLEQEKIAKEEEKQRLLYVALTRAKDRIVLPKRVPQRRGKSVYWEWMSSVIHENQAWVESVAFEDMPEAPSPKVAEKFSQEDSSLEEMKAEYEAILEKKRVDREPPVLPVAETGMVFSDALQLGTAFHHVMEKIDLANPNANEVIAVVCAELGISSMRQTLENLVGHFFQMEVWKKLKRAKKVYREVPFTWPHGERVHDGKIDLIFLDDQGWTIVDFKTDRLRGASVPDSYIDQITLYARAVENILHIKVTQGILAFVSDKQEKIVIFS